MGLPLSPVDEAKMRERSRKWDGVLGMKMKMKRKHMKSENWPEPRVEETGCSR